jgi:O-antigen/teichoic acid export membrane protein
VSLKQRTFSAGRWTATSALVRSGLQILQTVVLARLLVPADFGLMAVTVSILAVLGLFTDLGLSRAIIHFEDISDDALASLYWLNLLMGVVLSLLFATAAPLLSDMFGLAGLTPVLLATSPLFILSAVGQQFCSLAEKELRFSTLALNEIGSAALGFAVAVFVALRGGGVYALVSAVLVTAAINSALAWWRLSGGHRPRLHLAPTETKPYLRFGSYLVGEGLVNTLIRQADVLVAGLVVNSAALGLFSLPRDLSMRIGMVVNPIITRVGFPVMSRLQGDKPALKSVYLQTLRMTASVNFPAYVALTLFADEIVALLYGPQWKGAAVYLRVLAAWGLLRSTGSPVGSLLHAVGAVKRAFLWNVAVLMIVPLFYWIAVNGWGLTGLAAALVMLHVALVFPSWHFLVRPCCGATIGEYLRQLGTPLLLSLIAGLAAWLATRGVPHGTVRLAIGCVTGGCVYLGLSRVFNRQWFNAIWVLLRLPSRTRPSH